MKKIVLSLVFLFIFIIGMSNTYSDDIKQSIFKVYSYSYNELSGVYTKESFGSSIYLGNNQLLTNAHVILGEGNKPYGNYEICETFDFRKKPKCFTAGKLISYDEDKDLALLKLEKSPTRNKLLPFSEEKIELGDDVNVYGYPSNGGDTITLTTGKISGYDNGFYKIDASIDSGSSGGGAFNKKGELVGITTFVKEGYTSLGYLNTTENIKAFLINKGKITAYNKNNNNFKKYINKVHSVINGNGINLGYIKLDDINKYGFKIVEYKEDNSGLKIATLKDLNTYIIIRNKIRTLYIKEESDFEENITDFYELKGTIYIDGKKVSYAFKKKKTEDYFELSFYDFNYSYKIFGDINNKISIKKAIEMFSKVSLDKNKKIVKSNLIFDGVLIPKEIGFESQKMFSFYGNLFVTGNKKLDKKQYATLKGDEKSKIFLLNRNLYYWIDIQKFDIGGAKKENFILKDALDKVKEKGRNPVLLKTYKEGLVFYYRDNFGYKQVYTFEILKLNKGKLVSYNFIFDYYGKERIDMDLGQFMNNIKTVGEDLYSEVQKKEFDIKHINDVQFKNDNKIGTLKNPRDITHNDLVSLLEESIGKKYNNNFMFNGIIQNTKTKTSGGGSGGGHSITGKALIYKKQLIISKNNLRNSKYQKIVTKFENIVSKLPDKKVLDIYSKVKQIMKKLGNNPKYKDILNYLEAKLGLEIIKRGL